MCIYTRGVLESRLQAAWADNNNNLLLYTILHSFLGNELWIHFPSVLADKIRFILDDAFYHAKIAEINIHKEGKMTYKHN